MRVPDEPLKVKLFASTHHAFRQIHELLPEYHLQFFIEADVWFRIRYY